MIGKMSLTGIFTLMAGFVFFSCAKNITQNLPNNTPIEMTRQKANIQGTFMPIPIASNGEMPGSASFNGGGDTDNWDRERTLLDPEENAFNNVKIVRLGLVVASSPEIKDQPFIVKYYITGTDTLVYQDPILTYQFGSPVTGINLIIDTASFISVFSALSTTDKAKGLTPRLYFTGKVSLQQYYTSLPSFIFIPKLP